MNGGLYARYFLNNEHSAMFIAASSGYSHSWNKFLWHIETGPKFVFNPFYFGPEISTGVEWLIFETIAIGIKFNGQYLIDSSSQGYKVLMTSEGLPNSYANDTHFELKALLTVSYVFD